MDPDSSYLILIILTSLVFSGFITIYETSLSYLSNIRLQKRAEEGDKKSQYLLKILQTPHQTLLTLMICDWLADITAVVAMTYALLKYTENLWALVGFVLIVAPFILIFGEALPTSIATHQGESFLYRWLLVVKILLFIFYLPVKLLNLLTRPFLNITGTHFSKMALDFTEEELRRMVNLSGTTGVLEADESVLVSSALAFDDKPAKDVLTPRVDMVTVEDIITVDETLAIMIGDEGEGNSRLPVYKENLDQIIGMVHIKDLLKVKLISPDYGADPVGNFVRSVHHITEYQPINKVLKEMQARRTPMFIVTDEYGGTVGLITAEDLLEEIVGEIHDEYDIEETPQIVEVNQNTLEVDARLSVSELNEVMDLGLPEGRSIGGLVFDTIGQVPKVGESIVLENVELTVDEMDGIRIQKIRIHKILPSDPQGENELDPEDELSHPVG